MRESLKKQPAPIIQKKIFTPTINDDHLRSFQNMVKLNLAHSLMLQKQGILSDKQAKELCDCLQELSKETGECIGSDPLLEDYYFNFEKYIIDKCGIESGGALHTARSRNDLNSTIIRMNVRDSFFIFQSKLESLIDSILVLADNHIETVMTGYTHFQPAQPITFAHYLTGISEALFRDIRRIENSYETINRLPLGACAFAGTSFPIDRQYTADLLGFDSVIINTIDSVASRDYILELSADMAIMGTTLSRFASDLYIWATDEFGYVSVDDSLACCSSIMPQKRNPLVLEHAKAKAAHLIGAFTDAAAVLRGTPYGHCRDLSEMLSPFWRGLEEASTILELLTTAVDTLSVHLNEMERRTDSNYSTVTELADALVTQRGLPFREAHYIVGSVVCKYVADQKGSNQITVADLDEVYRNVIGTDTGFSDEELTKILSGKHSVDNKCSLGAPSPNNCKQMIKKQRQLLNETIVRRSEREIRLEHSYSNLFQLAQALK